MDSRAQKQLLAYVGIQPGSPTMKHRDSDSWYTPELYIQAARQVLGSIDLDPFSSLRANERINAPHIFTQDICAFCHPWPLVRTVWMNPPYGASMAKACLRFIDEFKRHTFSEAIVLTNNCSDTKWFQQLALHSQALCFTEGRIRFEAPDGKRMNAGNTRGQTFFYFGTQTLTFKTHFQPFGFVCSKLT